MREKLSVDGESLIVRLNTNEADQLSRLMGLTSVFDDTLDELFEALYDHRIPDSGEWSIDGRLICWKSGRGVPPKESE